jgi:hypothetical protein
VAFDSCSAVMPRARSFTRLADELEHTHPGAAGSLRKGMDDTAHGDPAGHHEQAPTHVGADEPLGVDDRHRAITCGLRAS